MFLDRIDDNIVGHLSRETKIILQLTLKPCTAPLQREQRGISRQEEETRERLMTQTR